MSLSATKLSAVVAAMQAGDKQKAVLLAAKFGELGEQRDAILSGREAVLRPAFQRQLGRDPTCLLDAAFDALQERYGHV